MLGINNPNYYYFLLLLSPSLPLLLSLRWPILTVKVKF